MADNKIDPQSWKLMQIGVVVRDREKTMKRLEALGIGPFETRILPPDREEWYRYPDEKTEPLEHMDFAIKEFREMKMRPSLEQALRQKKILKA